MSQLTVLHLKTTNLEPPKPGSKRRPKESVEDRISALEEALEEDDQDEKARKEACQLLRCLSMKRLNSKGKELKIRLGRALRQGGSDYDETIEDAYNEGD